MEFFEKEIKGIYEIFPKQFKDERGIFFESFNKENYEFISNEFVQINVSLSQKNVLRGLHFQNPPFSQGKLVQVLYGKALDVVVDLRRKSPTYKKYIKVILDSERNNQLWIPPGFAHGFLSLEDNTIFQYKCTAFYNKLSENTILWNDPELNINWGVKNPIVSEKDKNGVQLIDFKSPF